MKLYNVSEKVLKKINGGASFAYRIGQIIRFALKSTTPVGYTEFIVETVVNEMYLNE